MTKAKQYIDIYESSSGFFDNDGLIRKGREVYYYVKGGYYLALNDLDSAEICFRTELAYGKDINNQIGGYKGLMEVYTLRNISDSIAKYAAMSYSLNDSAYSLSEMQNVQKLRASYNYHHKQLLAEQEKRKTYKAYLVLGIFVLIAFLSVILALLLFFDFKRRKDAKIYQYRHSLEQLEKAQTELMLLRSAESLEAKELVDRKVKEMEELQSKLSKYLIEGQQAKVEEILDNSNIALHLRELLSKNPPIIASQSDFRELRMFMNETIPCFYSTFNNSNCTLRPIEYDVCLLIRFHFQPAEISKLTGRNDSYISNIRKTILQKAFGIVGAPKDLDKRILQIL